MLCRSPSRSIQGIVSMVCHCFWSVFPTYAHMWSVDSCIMLCQFCHYTQIIQYMFFPCCATISSLVLQSAGPPYTWVSKKCVPVKFSLKSIHDHDESLILYFGQPCLILILELLDHVFLTKTISGLCLQIWKDFGQTVCGFAFWGWMDKHHSCH